MEILRIKSKSKSLSCIKKISHRNIRYIISCNIFMHALRLIYTSQQAHVNFKKKIFSFRKTLWQLAFGMLPISPINIEHHCHSIPHSLYALFSSHNTPFLIFLAMASVLSQYSSPTLPKTRQILQFPTQMYVMLSIAAVK